MHHAKENFKTSKCPPSIAPLRYMGRAGKRIASCSAARRRGKRIPPTVGDQDGGRGRGEEHRSKWMVAGAGVGTGGERALVDPLAQSISSGSSRPSSSPLSSARRGEPLLPFAPLRSRLSCCPGRSSLLVGKDLLRGCARMVGLYLFRVVLGHGGRHLLNEAERGSSWNSAEALLGSPVSVVESPSLSSAWAKFFLLEHDGHQGRPRHQP